LKNILFFSPTGGHAGIDSSLETLVMGLDRTEYTPIVIFPYKAKLKQVFEENEIKCYELPLIWWFPIDFSSINFIDVLPRLRSRVDPIVGIINDEHIDIVLSNTNVALDAAIAAGICGVPHVFFLHAQFVPNIYVNMSDATRSFLYALVGKLSSKIVCCSRLLYDVISQYSPNSIYIYNGVDTDKFTYKQKELFTSGPKLKMICVGHYNKNKQQDFVLRALQSLRLRRPDLLSHVSFNMVGPGELEYKNELKRMIKEYHIEKQVFMEDFRDDIDTYLHKFNLYINSSITENLPISILEAMACGLPTLGNVNDGTLQLIDQGITGFRCSTPEDMAEIIIRLLETPGLLKNMSEAARREVEEMYSSKVFVQHFSELFKTITENPVDLFERACFISNLYETLVGASPNKHGKCRVLVIYPPAAMPTYILCIQQPFEYLKKNNLLEYNCTSLEEFRKSDLNSYDLVVCVRYFHDAAYDVLQATKRVNKPFIWVIDDNYSALHIENGKPVHEEVKNEKYERMFKDSSHVLVYSKDLFQFGCDLTNTITLMTPLQSDNDDLMHKSSRNDGIVVFGFMGTLLRDSDFVCVVPAIKRVIAKYKNKVRAEFIGYCPEELKDFSGVEKFDFIADYDEFRKFFASRKWDIGLAPLNDTSFNRSKTNNKYREYSSFGVAGIYSNVSAYKCVEDSKNGLLVNNTEEEWFCAICRLIDDVGLRKRLATNAYSDIKEHYSIDKNAKALFRILKSEIETNQLNRYSSQFRNTSSDIITIQPDSGRRYHMPRQYDPNTLRFSKAIRKKRRYKVYCDHVSIHYIGLLFGSENPAIGMVTIRLYEGIRLLRTVEKSIDEINYSTWNYFYFDRFEIVPGKLLTIEIQTDCIEGSIGVYEDSKHRTFIYKVLNKLGLHIPGRDALMVDFICEE
jgi:glycosyltransferase involved in cell wall biosynthesis